MQQITPNIYQISLGPVNAFIIKDNGLTLIDTGNKNSADKIFAAIKKGGENPNDIKRIILTHSHPDHAGSAADIKHRLGVPLLAHPEDAKLIAQGTGGRAMHRAPGILNWLIFNAFIKGADDKIEPVSIDEMLNDNDVIPIADGIQVVHTPGA